MIKYIITLFLIQICITGYSQLEIDLSKSSGYINIKPEEKFTDERDIKFISKVPKYSEELKSKGLHFSNKQENVVDNNFTMENLNSSPVLGANGSGTRLKYTGTFTADGGNSIPSLVIMDSSEIIFTKETTFDLIMDNSYRYGRPLYVYGDGTGTLEFKEGFVANLSDSGKVSKGIHSVRIADADLVTHHQQSIPLSYMPKSGSEKPAIYSHIYFEHKGHSTWHIRSNDQEYKGGIVIRDSRLTINTEKNFEISGEKSSTSYYTNWGGFMMAKNDSSNAPAFIKKGKGKFISSGDNAFTDSSSVIIEEGTFEFQSDPYTNHENKYDIDYYIFPEPIDDKNLICKVKDSAKLFFNTSMSRIAEISMTNKATLKTGIKNKVKAYNAEFNGSLKVEIPEGMKISKGDEFDLFDIDNVNGKFNNFKYSYNVDKHITWNYDKLYSEGIIKVANGNIVAGNKIKKTQENFDINYIYNTSDINIKSSRNVILKISDINGKVLNSYQIKSGTTNISLNNYPHGIYFYHVIYNDNIVKKGKLIR